jgi:bacillithiol biosynthesis cysteine-adding enzyme BshC
VVPVFVLGSEDHDLEELNHIHLFGRRLVWEPGESGAIGCMSTRGVLPLLDALRELGGRAPYLEPSMDMMEACYREAPDMASATRRLLHHLFGAHGLVVLDPNHSDLKRHFIEVMCDELEGQTTQRLVGATIERLREVGWKPQAVPRPVNLFYLDSGRRSRIVRESGGFRVEGTAGWWSLKDLQELVVEQPERFSPNVLLRPLYQEMLLPNLAYVGGGGELAYWLERKAQFEHFGVPFPVLLRRNSVLYVEGASLRKLQRLGISVGDIFTDTEGLIRHYVAAHQQAEVTLEAEMLTLSQLYGALAVKAAAVDASLEQAVHADAARALAGLEHWQGRLWKAEKQRHETALNQIRNLKDRLFPGGGLQERSENFLARYWQDGGGWIDTLLENLDPLEAGFVVLEL